MAAISSGTQPAMFPVARRSRVDKATPLSTLRTIRMSSKNPLSPRERAEVREPRLPPHRHPVDGAEQPRSVENRASVFH